MRTGQDLQELVNQRRVQFSCNKYFSDSWRFFKFNCCSLMTLTLLLGVLACLGFGASHKVAAEIVAHRSGGGNHDEPTNSPTLSPPWIGGVSNNGCYGSAGYTWCDSLQKCIRPWESSCPTMPVHLKGLMKRTVKIAFLAATISSVFMVFAGYPLVAACLRAVFDAIKTNQTLQICQALNICRIPYCKVVRMGFLLVFLRFVCSLFFIVPGIWFSIVSLFALPMIVDNNVKCCQAIRLSTRVIHRYCCSFFGFLVLLFLLELLGFAIFFVGTLITLPVAFVAFCYCYHHLVGIDENESPETVGLSVQPGAPINEAPLALPMQDSYNPGSPVPVTIHAVPPQFGQPFIHQQPGQPQVVAVAIPQTQFAPNQYGQSLPVAMPYNQPVMAIPVHQ